MFFTSIIAWVTDPKNRTILLFIFIALLIGLFFYQRSRTQHFRFKYEEQVLETKRVTNNYLASQDTLRQFKGKNGELIGEISGYKLTVEELNGKYSNLFTLYNAEKNKPPKVHIEYVYQIAESIGDIQTYIVGDTLITFSDSIDFENGNWRKIDGKIPYTFVYKIKKDSVNNFALSKALVYAFELQQRGMKDAEVIIYKDNNRITYDESKNADSIFYRVQIYESRLELSESQVAEKFAFDKDYIQKTYEDGVFRYMTGLFVPNKNNEPPIPEKELYTFAKLQTGNANINLKIGMTVATELYEDPETGAISLRVITKYPGVTFNDITGAEIMSTVKSNKKLARQMRQEWGVGANLGIGGMLVPDGDSWKMKFGPVISIGINYTPRWAQFGPRQKGKNSLDNLIP